MTEQASPIVQILADPTLTYNQQLIALARYAENTDHTIPLSKEYLKAKEERIL